ncbi:MAG: hypothetical protein GEV03_19360 [Streptosporangiales bacterium]|nr:hypothetical protein [Streptosporangiales bacterium]
MPNTPDEDRLDLNRIDARNRSARHIVAGLLNTTSTLAEIWRTIEIALADTPELTAEISRLRGQLADTRLDRANLLAAARAVIAAHQEGEPDPLSYIRDEIRDQINNRGRS